LTKAERIKIVNNTLEQVQAELTKWAKPKPCEADSEQDWAQAAVGMFVSALQGKLEEMKG
jgi:hypothetical protein